MPVRPDLALFVALADSTRLELVDRLLVVSELSTTELSQGTGMSRQAVHKHLEVLEAAGLVTQRRSGRKRLWALDGRPFRTLRDWSDRMRALWEIRFEQLARLPGEPDGEDEGRR